MAIIQPKMNPDQYLNQGWLALSTSTGGAVDLGFNATYLRIENISAETYYLSLGTTSATTGDYPLSTGEVISFEHGPQIRDLAASRNTATTDLDGVKIHALG